MDIRKALNSDIPQMKNIWKICFQDEDSYIDFYYNNGFNPNNTFIAQDGETISSMLTVFPTLFYTNANIYKGIYIYAVATLPKYRKMGLMRQIEEYACAISKKKGDTFACLVPQTEDLIKMYEKIGYTTNFFLGHKKMHISDYEKLAATTNINTLNSEYYSKLRQLYLSSLIYAVQFDGYFHDYAYKELIKAGGQAVSVQNKYGHGYVSFYISQKDIFIKEIGMSAECFNSSIHAICKKFNVENIIIRGNCNLFDDMEIKPYAMFKSLNENINFPFNSSPYMNMMLD